jgi:hypothetical protein
MKRILLLVFLFFMSCKKTTLLPPEPQNIVNFFDNEQNTISDGSQITFDLKNAGAYTMTILDSSRSQVVTREKISGKIGANALKIYTKSLNSKYLYLLLKDSVGNQIGKTLLIIK